MHRRCCLVVTRMGMNWVPPLHSHRQAAPSVHYTTSCKQILVLLRMGEIIVSKHFELIEIINIIIIFASSWLYILLYRWCWMGMNWVPPHPGHRQAASSVHYTTSCKRILVLLRMDKIIVSKHVKLIEIISKIIIFASSWLYILLYRWCTVAQISK